MSERTPSRWRSRLTMIVVVLVFTVPPVAAWVMLTGGWQPGGTVNNGELLQPPVRLATDDWDGDLDEDYFAGRWTLLHVVAGPCGEPCAALLDKTYRTRIALDKDAGRVQRLLLLPEGTPSVSTETARGATVVRASREAVDGLLGDGRDRGLSLVDPQGFRMMRYDIPLQAPGLLEDLERLLRLSKEEIERFQRRNAQTGQ